MTQRFVGMGPQTGYIIVIVPDEPGSLALVARALGDAGINIESIDGRLVADLGVIALSTSDDDAALHALLEEGLRAVTSDSILFHLPDRPGALAGVAELLKGRQINVRTIHIVNRLAGRAVVAMTTDDDDTARTILEADSLL